MTTTEETPSVVDPLEAVLGQSRAVSFLRQLHKTKRYPNALLFHGPPGVGKSYCALQYAKFINMTGDLDQDRRTEALVEGGEHPDIHVFSKGDASSFKIDIVRAALEESKNPLFEARRRVIILEDIQDFPSYKQSDALLKTVEDGYEDTLYIFTTTELEQVFPTLRSRMTSVQFSPLPQEVLRELLSTDKEDEVFEVAVQLSDGSLERASRFLHPPTEDALSGFLLRSRAMRLLGNLMRAPVHTLLKFVDAIPDSDEALFFEILKGLVRDLLLLEEGLVDDVVNYDILEELQELSESFDERVSDLYEPLRVLHDRISQKGLQVSHQLKNSILRMRGGLLDG